MTPNWRFCLNLEPSSHPLALDSHGEIESGSQTPGEVSQHTQTPQDAPPPPGSWPASAS